MTDQPTCETCRFWSGSAWDECRRRPRIPVLFTDDQGINSEYQFARAEADDWCGEHEPVVEADPTVGQWRDVATYLPAFGRRILGWSPGLGVTECSLQRDGSYFAWWPIGDGAPTHWMPMPTLPDGSEA